MKAYDVALCVMFFLFAVNIIGASGVFGANGYPEKAEQLNANIVGNAPATKEEYSYAELAISSFGLLIRSLVVIVLTLVYSTILLPLFLGQLGLPIFLTAPITFGVWLTYIIGYNQYRSRQSISGLE